VYDKHQSRNRSGAYMGASGSCPPVPLATRPGRSLRLISNVPDPEPGPFEVFLAKDYLKEVDREKGRFRSFLLASLKHYLANEWKKGTRQKRGGHMQTVSFDAMQAEERYRHEPTGESSAELAFDRR